MKVLSRYVTKEFLKLFLLCESVFVFIYLMIDFLQKVDNFIAAKASEGAMLLYFLYKTPFIITNMIPPATLIAVIMFFSTMRKRNEITAIRVSGMNIVSLSRTVLGIAFFIALFSFLFAEIVVPLASTKGQGIWKMDVLKQDPGLYYGKGEIWYRGQDAIYWVRQFDGTKKVMEGVSFYFFDDAFRLRKRIDGRSATWENNSWKVEKGLVQEARDDGSYEPKRFDVLYLDLPETPETFMKGTRKPEEMNYGQLRRYAATVKGEGYDNTKYLVDMNIKIAFPLISFILVLVGIPLALQLKTGGAPLAVAGGMAVCFMYILVFGFSRSLGLSGVFPPLFSAWLANLVFSLIGIYMMMHLEK
jgi:lipopolysaccharide export system permease protein